MQDGGKMGEHKLQLHLLPLTCCQPPLQAERHLLVRGAARYFLLNLFQDRMFVWQFGSQMHSQEVAHSCVSAGWHACTLLADAREVNMGPSTCIPILYSEWVFLNLTLLHNAWHVVVNALSLSTWEKIALPADDSWELPLPAHSIPGLLSTLYSYTYV